MCATRFRIGTITYSLMIFFIYFQYRESLYIIRQTKNNGSWLDAQRVCEGFEGGHLWTINSHEQWTILLEMKMENIYNSIYHDSYSLLLFDPLSSPQSFIGLKNNKVKYL